MSIISDRLFAVGEPYAAGMFEQEDRSEFVRIARGLRRYFERQTLPEYAGGKIYPSGYERRDPMCFFRERAFIAYLDHGNMKAKAPEAYEEIVKLGFMNFRSSVPWQHGVGGNLYTHSSPYYERILKEGFNSYRERIMKCKDNDFRDGLLDLLEGIYNYRERCIEYLEKVNAEKCIVEALKKVPFEPAETLYEAIVGWNFIFYIDGCDNFGWLDHGLYPYYKGEDVTDVLREMFVNMDMNTGWSCSLGPYYNELTVQCLKAVRGLRRPMIELRVTDKMPEEVWKEAIATVKNKCGQPAFYNEKLISEGISKRFPEIPKEDLERFCGGGCTEAMLAGLSNVGSLDAGINLLYIFKDYMDRKLPEAEDFDSFFDGYSEEVNKVIDEICADLLETRARRAKEMPNPLRTLLMDDCIDRELDYNAGGARYMWSDVNFAGHVNVIESLAAIRKYVFEDKKYDGKTFVRLINEEDPELYAVLKKGPHYGTDDDGVGEITEKLTKRYTEHMLSKEGNEYTMGFLPSSIQFMTAAEAGRYVGPTPDGRRNGEPLCESISAINANDVKGPTSLIKSVTKMHLENMPGIPVFNFNVRDSMPDDILETLIKAYLNLGGVQMQITCTNKEELLDALKNPDAHRNLVVRVGGYSEYFCVLYKELQQLVVERTLHENY